MLLLAAALVACKAVYDPAAARRCPGLETDLLARDGRFVMAHGPDVQPGAPDLDAFVAGLPSGLEMVNLDFKDRQAPLGPVLERHRPALRALAGKARLVVYSSPVPWRYAELKGFLASGGLGVAGFELADYTAGQAAAWGLPLPWWQRPALPALRAFSALFARWEKPAWLIMQEETARRWRRPGPVMCWTRERTTAPAPERCAWTQRNP